MHESLPGYIRRPVGRLLRFLPVDLRSLPLELRVIKSRLLPEPLRIKPIWIELGSGIRILIDSELTLKAFIEIFLTPQEYTTALSLPPQLDVVVDIGANRGLFTLLVCDYLRKTGSTYPQVFCIEPAKENYRCLERHIKANSLTGNSVLVHGAVTGQRNGVVQLQYYPDSHGMSVVVNKRRLTTQAVKSIDLAKLLNDIPRVDLLKMDIEGAEQAVIEQYPDVLDKVQVLVAEFHLKKVDYEKCKSSLADSGLLFHSCTYSFQDRLRVDIFVRS